MSDSDAGRQPSSPVRARPDTFTRNGRREYTGRSIVAATR